MPAPPPAFDFDFAALPARFGGHLVQAPAAPAAVRHLLLDSRRAASAGPGSLFVALRGPQHDAHRYLPEVYAQGGRLLLVQADQPLPGGPAAYPEAGIWAVPDPLATLQALAAAHRAAFAGPVLAITGSNGKTIVKEWLAQLLAPDESICRSPRSYNSQVGVPLSVWELSPERHTLGIFEAGISEMGEMARLAAVIRPTEGIFTTLGSAHDAGFASAKAKLHEKLRLFQEPGFERLYYCCDQPPVHAAVQALALPALGWTEHDHPAAAIRFQVTEEAHGPAATIETHYQAQRHLFTAALPDAPTRQNLLHCLAVLLVRQVEPAEIQRRLARLHPVAMRLEMKQGRHNSYLLDDTYNNDLAGLALALDALRRQSRPGPRTVILSDVLESGLPAAVLYARVAQLLQAHGVTRLVAIGSYELGVMSYELGVGSYGLGVDTLKTEPMGLAQQQAATAALPVAAAPNAQRPTPKTKNQKPNTEHQKPNTEHQKPTPQPTLPELITHNSKLITQYYPSTEAFLAVLNPLDFAQQTILVKGARRFGFERIVAALQAQQHGTVLEVNLDALAHNLNHYRQLLRPGTRLMVMVKAFAYGAGAYEVASLLEFQRADYLAVAYTDEGVALREAGISLPIMVMNPAPDSFGLLRRYRLEPEIYSFELLDAYLAATADGPLPPLHLKLDTGMRRLGFDEADGPALAAQLRQHRAALPVAALLTHLAAADDPAHDDFTRTQLAAFDRLSALLAPAIGRPVLRHALNSAGITRFPEAQLDMVRLGIGLHGVDAAAPTPVAGQPAPAGALRLVSTLRTSVSQVKTLPAGSTVGYGRRGLAAPTERRIATLAIGYADGYDRRFGHGVGAVLLPGGLAPVVGAVCMDMVMVDVTHLPAVQAGDVAEVFGPGRPLPALAASIGTIAYELLTRVSERVKRVFVSE